MYMLYFLPNFVRVFFFLRLCIESNVPCLYYHWFIFEVIFIYAYIFLLMSVDVCLRFYLILCFPKAFLIYMFAWLHVRRSLFLTECFSVWRYALLFYFLEFHLIWVSTYFVWHLHLFCFFFHCLHPDHFHLSPISHYLSICFLLVWRFFSSLSRLLVALTYSFTCLARCHTLSSFFLAVLLNRFAFTFMARNVIQCSERALS